MRICDYRSSHWYVHPWAKEGPDHGDLYGWTADIDYSLVQSGGAYTGLASHITCTSFSIAYPAVVIQIHPEIVAKLSCSFHQMQMQYSRSFHNVLEIEPC
jgi:hypothetical protein